MPETKTELNHVKDDLAEIRDLLNALLEQQEEIIEKLANINRDSEYERY